MRVNGMTRVDVIVELLEVEYAKGKERQHKGAKRDSGFMTGIKRALEIAEILREEKY